MNYKRGDVVILPFPFVTQNGAKQKARPAMGAYSTSVLFFVPYFSGI
jgi:hypothetical protein